MTRPSAEADGATPRSGQLVRFALVGGLGTATNLGLFFLFVDRGSVAPVVGSVVCFAIAVTQNYVLNELWTFQSSGGSSGGSRGGSSGGEGLALRRYVKFVGASLLGLGVNLVVLMGLLALYDFPFALIPQAIGIAAGTVLNFVVSSTLVFDRGAAEGG